MPSEPSPQPTPPVFIFLILTFVIASAAVMLAFQLTMSASSRLQPRPLPSRPDHRLYYYESPTPSYPTSTPTPTPADFTPPSLPPGLKWTLVPISQQKVNKRALGWSTQPVRCTSDDCRTPYIVKDGYFVLSGQEWVTYQLVNGYQEPVDSSPAYDFYNEARRINWNPGEATLGPERLIVRAEGGAMDLTYDPRCAFAIRGQQVRVACLVEYISPQHVSGQGMAADYTYPFSEELRFFVSDVLSLSSLTSQI